MSNKLNFNLDFLDKESRTEKTTSNHDKVIGGKHSKKFVINWKILIGVIALIVVLVLVANGSNSTTVDSSVNSNPASSTPTDTNNQDNCSQAAQLKPSAYEKSDLDDEQSRLQRLKNEIDYTYVDNSSQYSVNNYNSLVDTYNIQRQKYLNDLDDYNAKINRYNSYIQNCSR